MAIVRWGLEPFREIDELQREMNRLFSALAPAPLPRGDGFGVAFVPPAEITETPEAIHLKLEVPGLEAKDLDIEVTAESVTITGERKSETKIEEGGATRTEFRYGKFRREIPLPVKIQNTDVTANYENGILTMNLPKAELEKTKVVKVNLG